MFPGMDGLVFIMIIVFTIGAVTLVTFICVMDRRKKFKVTPIHPIGHDDKFKNSINDHENITLEQLKPLAKFGAKLEIKITEMFTYWGTVAARFPIPVIFISTSIAVLLSVGIMYLQVTTNPIELWASPTSRSRVEKDFFDSNFRPFYRTSQVIIRALEMPEHNITKFNFTDHLRNDLLMGPVFHNRFLKEVLALQKRIEEIEYKFTEEDGIERTLNMKSVCNKPLSPEINECNIQNVLAYWQDNEDLLDVEKFDPIGNDGDQPRNWNYIDHFLACANNPTLTSNSDKLNIGCMAKWGAPVQPYYCLGGFIPKGESLPEEPAYHQAEAVVMSFILDNYDSQSKKEKDVIGLKKAMAWEKEFVEFMLNWVKNEKPEFMDVAFNSERSIEDELEKETYGDVMTIIISYIIMFIYITFTLGQASSCSISTFMIESKVTLGLGGVIIVLLSVTASIGIFAFVGIPATLIIFEIIPFLVLAIGVDNIFILVQTYQREPRGELETHAEHVGRIVGEVAPSMLVSSLSESTCFFLGALSDMPAVRAFALYAGMAILLDFLMQITCFVSLLSLDISREESRRFDVFCCFKGEKKSNSSSEGVIYNFFNLHYSPFLMKKWVRGFVMILFLGWTCSSMAVIPKIEVGLDQEISMPDDSFVLKYFSFLKDYLSVGPPVYFVLNNTAGHLDLSTPAGQNKLCLGLPGCQEDSLAGQVFNWQKAPKDTYIATAPMPWIDGFVSWATAEVTDNVKCCQYFREDFKFCPSSYVDNTTSSDIVTNNPNEDNYDYYGDYGDYGDYGCDYGDPTCGEKTDKAYLEGACLPCNSTFNKGERPGAEQFIKTIDWFLSANPSDRCPSGGHAAYGESVKLHEVQGKKIVSATNMMAFHTILKTSEDYYTALSRARELSDSIMNVVNNGTDPDKHVNVFPYSVFYVFYEQYLTMWRDTITSLLISISAIFCVTYVFMGFDITSSLINLIIILLIVVNMGGLMYWWDITLNAISLVNLVMTVGISVEFCCHTTRAFAVCFGRDKVERASKILTTMGTSVLSGIALTNLFPTLVLAFAKSQIFTIFYFR